MATARAIANRLHLPTTFVKFLIVGGIGFLVNNFFLFLTYDSPVFWFFPDKDTRTDLGLFVHPDIRLLISSIIAVEVAIVTQFNLHERWTFRWRPRGGWWIFRFLKFNLSSIVSPIIVVVTVNVLTPVFGISPYIAVGIGVLLGFTWNWTVNSLIIWPRTLAQRAGLGESSEGGQFTLGMMPAVASREVYAAILDILRPHHVVFRYVIVGAVGYVIYTGILFVMYDLAIIPGLPEKGRSIHVGLFTHGDSLLLITTLIGTQASILGAFTGHNAWTFSGDEYVRRPLWVRFLQFETRALVSTLGILTAAVNLGVVVLDMHPYLAVPMAVFFTFLWNWVWDSRLIWRRKQDDAIGGRA